MRMSFLLASDLEAGRKDAVDVIIAGSGRAHRIRDVHTQIKNLLQKASDSIDNRFQTLCRHSCEGPIPTSTVAGTPHPRRNKDPKIFSRSNIRLSPHLRPSWLLTRLHYLRGRVRD